jgi:Fe-S-cluster-containing dehydrogenase component
MVSLIVYRDFDSAETEGLLGIVFLLWSSKIGRLQERRKWENFNMESKSAEQLVLFYDPDRCTGCRFCMISCAVGHYNELNMDKALLFTFFDEGKELFESAQCQHCEDPVCLNSCPEEAIEKDEDSGIVTINPMKAVKCDFCDGDPKCAKYCSPRATRVVTREEAYKLNEKLYGKGTVIEK